MRQSKATTKKCQCASLGQFVIHFVLSFDTLVVQKEDDGSENYKWSRKREKKKVSQWTGWGLRRHHNID